MSWQVHVYGSASAALREWCDGNDVPLYVFQWQPAHEAAGFARNALYLIRPDTYVALADTSGMPQVLDIFFTSRGIKLPTARTLSSARSDDAALAGGLDES